jgi:hypothetical protein
VKGYSGPPMSLGKRRCGQGATDRLVSRLPSQVEPDPAEMAERHRAETSVPDWHKRLVCSGCGGRNVDMVARDEAAVRFDGINPARYPECPAAPVYDHQPTILVTLETAVTALARIGYMPVVRLSTTVSPPGVVIVSDPVVLTNDNQWVAVGKVPVDVPSAKARFGALEAEAILFPQPVTTGGYRAACCQYVPSL